MLFILCKKIKRQFHQRQIHKCSCHVIFEHKKHDARVCRLLFSILEILVERRSTQTLMLDEDEKQW